ncbi:MAG: HD domain-containing protein [Deltaproteobacteria bacterium]|nr:HD domain-containing protein [Deltaproteobacteria bacterium]
MQDISSHKAFFTAYFERFLALEAEDKTPLALKYEHSMRVLEHLELLVADAEFASATEHLPLPFPALERAGLLAALYHDIARFPQFVRWRTFRDSQSINHGQFGVKILKSEAALKDESREPRRLVQSALVLHNRYRLPQKLPPEVRLIADAVRDADKLDICRVFAAHLASDEPRSSTILLSVKDDPDLYSPKVLEDALARRVAAYADLRSVNDFRVLLGTWQYDLRFAFSRRRLAQEGRLRRLLEDLPALPALDAVRKRLLADLARAAEAKD